MRSLVFVCLFFCCGVCAMQNDIVLTNEQVRKLTLSMRALEGANKKLSAQNIELLKEIQNLEGQIDPFGIASEESQGNTFQYLLSILMITCGYGIINAYL